MNIKIKRMGDGGEIETEHENNNAWYATVQLGRHHIHIKETDGKLEILCSTGVLFTESKVANMFYIIPRGPNETLEIATLPMKEAE